MDAEAPQGHPSPAVECLTRGLFSDARGPPSIRLGCPAMNSSQMPLPTAHEEVGHRAAPPGALGAGRDTLTLLLWGVCLTLGSLAVPNTEAVSPWGQGLWTLVQLTEHRWTHTSTSLGHPGAGWAGAEGRGESLMEWQG